MRALAEGASWGDGRTARRDRNKEAVLDAVIALFTEDNLDPGPDQVAERVGLSARSVYRYFEDREGLVRAAIERHLERVFPHYLIHAIGEGPLDERIERFVTARLRLYETIAATARASRLRAVTDPIVAEQVRTTRAALGEQVTKHFSAELRGLPAAERRSLSATLDGLCQLETLDHFRAHLGLSGAHTHRLLVTALSRLLTGGEQTP